MRLLSSSIDRNCIPEPNRQTRDTVSISMKKKEKAITRNMLLFTPDIKTPSKHRLRFFRSISKEKLNRLLFFI